MAQRSADTRAEENNQITHQLLRTIQAPSRTSTTPPIFSMFTG
jgi:hypothetical protein